MDKCDNEELRGLIVRCQNHDGDAFTELITKYTPMIRKVVSGFADGTYGTEELFSEGCVALHSAVQRYDVTQSEVTFGLYARICVHNRMIDLMRRQNSQPEIVPYEADTVLDATSIESGVENREAIELIMGGARRLLSDYEYRVLMLHIQGYKTRQIAEKLSKTPKSIDNAKARLFKRLREEFSGFLGRA